MSDLPAAHQVSEATRRRNPHLYGAPEQPVKRERRPGSSPKTEGDLHDDFEKRLRARGWLYIHARMDLPSTIQVGHPDFTVFMQRPPDSTSPCAALVEFKKPGGKATTEQLAKVAHALKLGWPAGVFDDVDEAWAILEKAMKTGLERLPKDSAK